MKKYVWMIGLGALMALAGCVTDSTLDEFTADSGTEGGTPGGGGGSGTASSAGNLLSLAIDWDDVDESSFTDAAETVPTDENDEEYDDFVAHSSFTSQVKITYNGTSAAVTGEVDGVAVTTDGGYVTVNSSAKNVEYVLAGTATDGAFKIYSEKKFKLSLSGVSLTSTQGAAINIQSGKRAFIELAAGTTNTLTDAASYTNTPDGEDQKACLFSEGQLLFSGSGQLTVTGNYKHGICSDEYAFFHAGTRIAVAAAVKDAVHTNEKIIIGGGVLTLTPSGDGLDCEEGNIDIRGGLLKAKITGTASKGIKAETDLTVTGGTLLVLTSGGGEYDSDSQDLSSSAGMKCGGNLSISNASVSLKSTGAAGKGINCDGTLSIASGTVKVITTGQQYVYGQLDSSAKGIKADGTLTISGGTVLVSTTGGEGSEGIESKDALVISGGTVGVHAYDDCLNATNSIQISGGEIYCYSDGNDGIDSNGTLSISGGLVVASGTTVPEEGIDCDQNTFTITGGTLIGIGGATSTPTASTSSQRSVIYGGSGSAGTLLTIASADGTQLMSYVIPRDYSQMTVLYSSPSLTQNTSYTIYTGGSIEGGTAFYGLTTGATYTTGTQLTTFTASAMVTTVGSNTAGGGGGGQPGGGNRPGGGGGRP